MLPQPSRDVTFQAPDFLFRSQVNPILPFTAIWVDYNKVPDWGTASSSLRVHRSHDAELTHYAQSVTALQAVSRDFQFAENT